MSTAGAGLGGASRRRTVYLVLRAFLIWAGSVLLVATFLVEISLLVRLNDIAENNQRINVENQRFIRETAVCLSILPRADRTEHGLEKCVKARLENGRTP